MRLNLRSDVEVILASARAWEEALVQMCSGTREDEQGTGASDPQASRKLL